MLQRRICSILIAFVLATPAFAQTAEEEQRFSARLAAVSNGGQLPSGTLVSIRHLWDTATRIEDRFPEASGRWRARAERYLAAAERGEDAYQNEKGKIVARGYRSPVSTISQGYAVYLPPNYDPSRRYPLYVALHGGSSNGNLFLGVVLGNNMDWLQYDKYLYDDFEPRWTPDWIVVAPTGFGQVLWRWMGEQDVLDVISDVERHYSVDADRIVLGGLSNGGLGAHAIGMRHASRFAVVQAMAGAPSWVFYVGEGRLRAADRTEVHRFSAMHLLENSWNTSYRWYHGNVDPGPMRPAFLRAFEAETTRVGAPVQGRWLEAGHDILYMVHRHGRVYTDLADIRRNPAPREVRVASGDYRAATQHWLTITRFMNYPELGRLRATVGEDGNLTIESGNVEAFAIDLRKAPVGEHPRIVVDGHVVFEGAREALGDRFHLVRGGDHFRPGFPSESGLTKKPGLAGPITDAYYGRMVHVYGTQNAEHTDELESSARRGARGFPLWTWDVAQEVVADTAVTDEMMQNATLVLYGTASDNALWLRVAGALPIGVDSAGITVGSRRFDGDVGARFIYPNPLAPSRYLIGCIGVTPAAVRRGSGLPEFLPDFAVYDSRGVSTRQDRIVGSRELLARGYFDSHWQLPAEFRSEEARGVGAGDEPQELSGEEAPEQVETLPVPRAPAAPARPAELSVPAEDPAGSALRAMWDNIEHFHNYRAEIGGAEWRTGEVWRIRPQAECLAALDTSNVPHRLAPDPNGIVATPVEIVGPVGGIWFRMLRPADPFVVSCELAARLPRLVEILRQQGVYGVEVMSAWRPTPFTSFHTMGLALDLPRFWTRAGWASVQTQYEATPMEHTCTARRANGTQANVLKNIACGLWREGLFQSVLTPNYNEGHRDHLHLDARPDDPRLFLR